MIDSLQIRSYANKLGIERAILKNVKYVHT